MIKRNDNCWCGSERKWKQCHYPQTSLNANAQSATGDLKKEYQKKYNIILKTPEQIAGIREASHLASSILQDTCALAKEGVTTAELNDFAHKLHLEAGAIPAPLNYGSPPYPKSICTSINEVICHGIPDKTILKQGDIINIDVTSIYKGYYGDCSMMVCIGQVSPERQLVVDVAYESLMRSIEILRPGAFLSDIGRVIEDYANAHGCSAVNQFVGHGVGVKFHEGPQIPHFRNAMKIVLVPGMTFTIEPMINAGVREAIIENDQWTARTRDNRASAQWEHTILITDTGYELLTNWKR